MFKIIPDPTFVVPVEITVPGHTEKGVLTVTYKHLGKKARAEFFEGLDGRNDEDMLADIIVGWDGADRPYSPEALADLLDGYPLAGHELFGAYAKAAWGAGEKNSLTLPVPGQS